MSILLGSAYGKVSLDASGVKKGVSQAASDLKKLQAVGAEVGKAMQDVGRKMTIGLTLPILALGGAALKMATDFKETKNKTVVVFEDMADSVIENSNKSAKALGINKEAYMDYASSIGAALKAGGMGIKETTALSEQAVKHFADLASFHNAQVQDVATAWQSAIRGQYEPIQKYFPFITNEYLKTYGIANGMLDANTKNLTANQRAAILNAIALEEKLNPALDDFAETSGGLANQMRIMDAQFKDALIMLGQNLLPIALEVVNGLNSMLEKFNQMSPATQKAIIGIGAFLAVLGPIVSTIGTLITAVSSISGVLTGMGVALPATGAGLAGVGAAISGTLLPALAVIGPVLLAILPAAALLYFAFKTNFGGIRTTAEQLWFLLKYGFKKMFESIKVTLGQLGYIMEYFFTQAIDSLRNWLVNGISKIPETFAKVKTSIVAFFRQDWSQFGKMIIIGIVNGIMGGLSWLASAVKAIASVILGGLAKSLKSHSPSEEGEYYGRTVPQGLVNGIRSGKSDLVAAARDAANTVIQQFASAQAAWKDYLSGSGFSGKSQFKAPTSSNMQAAFAQFAQAQAGMKPASDPFSEKSRPVKTEMPIVMNFEKGITTKEAHDIYSEKLGDVLSFLEKRLGG